MSDIIKNATTFIARKISYRPVTKRQANFITAISNDIAYSYWPAGGQKSLRSIIKYLPGR